MTNYERALFVIFAGGICYAVSSVTGFFVGCLWALIVLFILALFEKRI